MIYTSDLNASVPRVRGRNDWGWTVRETTTMKTVPQDLLERVRKVAPPEAEVMPLPWAFEQEDYNLAVVMPDTVDRLAARQIEDRVLDVIIDYDEAHDTFTVCKVWRQHDMA